MTKDAGVPQKRQFILYDARARSGDTDDAAVLDTAETEREAKRVSRSHHGENAVWYEYEVDGANLLNERPRYDL